MRARFAMLMGGILALAVVLLFVRPAPAELGPDPLPSAVIFPRQRLPISFSHKDHIGYGVACVDCHADARTSTSVADILTPPEAACSAAGCHAIDRAQPDKQVAKGQPDAACASCHVGWDGLGAGPPRLVVPTANLKFNHKLHVERGTACRDCHAVGDVNIATRAQLPRMSSCLGCHDGHTAPDRCTSCHLASSSGRVQTSFAEGDLIPSGTLFGDAHGPTFRTNHASVAKDQAAYCASCHEERFCADCHNNVAKPMDYHAGDYVALHAGDARRGTTECAGCHRLQTFCVGCHERQGVAEDQHTSEHDRPSLTPSPRFRFHPEGWTDLDGGGRRRSDHAYEAQRDIRACAACHREETCLRCHAMVGGGTAEKFQQANPHPAGWARSARCRALAARAGRMCLKCHIDLESAQCE